MYLEEKLMFIRLNKFDFQKLKFEGPTSALARKFGMCLTSEHGYGKTRDYYSLLYPFIELYKKMYPDGPHGEEIIIDTTKLKGHYHTRKMGKIPDIITSCRQIPFQ